MVCERVDEVGTGIWSVKFQLKLLSKYQQKEEEGSCKKKMILMLKKKNDFDVFCMV